MKRIEEQATATTSTGGVKVFILTLGAIRCAEDGQPGILDGRRETRFSRGLFGLIVWLILWRVGGEGVERGWLAVFFGLRISRCTL
jgi:hypothetical protein